MAYLAVCLISLMWVQEQTPWFAVMFGGFFHEEKFKRNRQGYQILGDIRPLACPSIHIIGKRDPMKKV